MHAQDYVNPHILRMLEGTFSLDVAQLFCFKLGQVLLKGTRGHMLKATILVNSFMFNVEIKAPSGPELLT